MREKYNFKKMQKTNNLTQKQRIQFHFIKNTKHYVLLKKKKFKT